MTNQKLYDSFYIKHIEDGGKMPHETALTNLAHHCIRLKDFTFIDMYNGNCPNLYDVVAYSNWANDVFFGVVTGIDSNVIQIESGTSAGVLKKVYEL